MKPHNPWTKVSSKIVYENPYYSVREDQVIRPDGSHGTYSVVLLPHSVGVVAINDRDEVALVTQWRYVHDKESIEIPTGGLEQTDSSLQEAAERELIEETGLRASNWTSLGSIDNSNGATTDVAHIFLATNLSEGLKAETADEQTSLSWVGFDQAVSMAREGLITESTSVAALLKVAFERAGA